MPPPPPPAPAIPAATLILVRDVPGQAPEILMVERASTMVFAAGAMVFPGGRIDPQDVRMAEMLGIADGAAIVAAIRETIEETAIPVGISPLPSVDLARELQRALLADVPFTILLDQHVLRLEPGALRPFARWIPKIHLTRRFDTMFFLAQAPPGDWQPVVGERENRSAEWLGAAEVLRRDEAGKARLIFPTRCNLERLAQHDCFADILADAARHPVEAISPWIEERGGRRLLTIPSHLGYPVIQHPLEPGARL